jgi:exonuclease SbcC
VESSSVLAKRQRERKKAADEAKDLADAQQGAQRALAVCNETLATRAAAVASAEQALERARHQDLVAAVSSGLAPGDPCPVCGQPLAKGPKRRAAGALEKARAALAEAREAQDAARAEVAAAERAAHEARAKRSANASAVQRLDADLAELDASIERTRADLRDALGDPLPSDPTAEIERRLAELRRLDQAEREATLAVAETRRARVEAERERERVVAGIERQRDRLTFDPAPLIDRARRAIGAGAPTFDVPRLDEAVDSAALTAHAERLGQLMTTLSDRLAEEAEARMAPQARLLDEAHRAVGDLVDPAASLEALAEAVTAACRFATAAVATAERDAGGLAKRLARKKELSGEAKELEGRAILFKALAQELRADHLVAYLQAEALQTLAQAGSERLASLSDGRYRVVCRDDEFLVVDTWNGDEERSVRTLSGGETFLASLALALALADQVRSMSVTDRARLDSLFLDEGFGTLDAETLRTVTDAIEQLAQGGRLVGVITHVTELAEQFPRIEVHKERTGSRLELVS